MARKSIIERNEKRRRMIKRHSMARARLKKTIYDKTVGEEARFAAALKLARMPRNSSATRIRSRCALTGRGRGVYRRFGLSRVVLREMASFGQVPGVVRSSW